jgi:hypothetical protein
MEEKNMSEEKGTIEKVLAMQPFKVFDSHGHPGLEKKGITERPGCLDFWCGDSVVARSMMGARAFLGDPNPFKVISKPEECPNITPETFIQYMDMAGVEAMCLQCIHGITDPFPGIHPPTIGYPNNPDLYPAYEKCQELGLHVQIHTGVEELPGTRAKYQDPVYVDDVAMDFPNLKILQLHCGVFNNPMMGLWNVMKHDNLYTDITIPHPTLMQFKYYWDLDHLRFLEFFMPDKVFYGTDFPLTLPVYRAMVDNIMNLPLTMEFKHKLMGNNFRKFLNWKSAE